MSQEKVGEQYRVLCTISLTLTSPDSLSLSSLYLLLWSEVVYGKTSFPVWVKNASLILGFRNTIT